MKFIFRILSLCIVGFFLIPAQTYAAPGNFTFSGRIVNPDNTLLEAPSVDFTIHIFSSGVEDCLLYEERHTLNMAGTGGVFSINVGTGLRTGSGYEDLSDLNEIFDNTGPTLNGLSCASGLTYTPAPEDRRRIRMVFNDGSGAIALDEPMTVNAVPYAMYASKLQGREAVDFLQTNLSDNVTQNNIEDIFTGTGFGELLDLVNGASTLYAKSGTSGANSLPQFSSADPITAPVTGDIWFDSDSGEIKYYDGTTTQAVSSASGAGTVTGVTVGEGLVDGADATGTTITTTGTIKLPDIVLADTYYKVATDAKGRVVSGATSLVETDLPVIATPGKVSGDAITSGTIGGSTSISTTGSGSFGGISTRTQVFWDSDNTNSITVSPPATGALTSNYVLTLPVSSGDSNQVLTTDGDGVLSWVDDGGGDLQSDGSVVMAADFDLNGNKVINLATPTLDTDAATKKYVDDEITTVTGGLSYTASDITNTPAGNVSATNVQTALNELDTEKQGASAELDGMSTLSTTGLVERTGAGTYSTTAVTAAGKALLDDADAAAQRTTLGLGTMAEESAADFMTKAANLSDVADVSTSRNNLGLQDMALQDSSSVAITGGAINGTAIGATTAASGAFTSLSAGDADFSGNLSIAATKTVNLGVFTTAQESTLIGTLTAVDAGQFWYNSSTSSLMYWDGGSAVALGVSGAGLQSLAGDTSGAQTLSIENGAAVLVPTWDHDGSGDHSLQLPMASGAGVTAGLISKTDFDAFAAKMDTADTLPVDQISSGASKYFSYAPNGVDCASGEILVWNVANGWICGTDNAGGDLESDGSVAMAANFNLNSNKIVNLATPTVDTDASTKKYVDDSITAATGGLSYTAADIVNVAAGNISATNVQAALNELDADKQATSAELTGVSGLTTTGTVERTGAGAYSTYSVTAAGKALLDDAGVAAQRTTLGLGTAAEENIGTTTGNIPVLGTTLTANGIMMANGAGTAIDSVTCLSSEYLVYNGTNWSCTAVPTGTDTAAFHNGGDSFGTIATIGTNDNFALNFESNGSTAMTLLPSGNVGIGTANPRVELDVNGTLKVSKLIGASNSLNLYVDSAVGSDANDGFSSATAFATIKKAIDTVPVGGSARIRLFSGQTYVINSPIAVYNKHIILREQPASPITIEMNASISLNGNSNLIISVGSSTGSPSSTLIANVQYPISVSDGSSTVFIGGYTAMDILLNVENSALVRTHYDISGRSAINLQKGVLSLGGSVTQAYLVYQQLAGSVSVDSWSYGFPGANFSISNLSYESWASTALTYGNISRVLMSAGASGQSLSGISGLAIENASTSNTNYVLQTASAAGKSFSVTSAGNVGIGTTSPDSKLDVAGIIRAEQICDETGANCRDISTGWGAGGDFMADGSVAMTGSLDAGGNTVINLAAPTVDTDASTKKYVDDSITTATGSLSYTAADIANVAAGNIAATNVQAALNELDAEKQAASAELTGVSGLASTGTVERTGAGAYSTYSVTAAGKSLLDDADSAAQRTTLGLGSAAEENIGTTAGDIPVLGTTLTANGIMMANGTGTAIDSVTCLSSQYLVYNGTNWTCTAIPMGTDTAAFHDGGDSFGAIATLGTNDNFALNLETNGSSKMTILSDGNVGIGTTSPLVSPGYTSLSVDGATSGVLELRSSGTQRGALFYDGTSLKLRASGDGNILTLDTASTERMRIDASGNVGIGTASPNSLLDVAGIIRAQQICDETGANCRDISSGWGAGGDFMADGSVAMTGSLNANSNKIINLAVPTLDTDASTKKYVDDSITAATGGLSYTAADIANVAAGSISATNVQAALNELDADKQAASSELTGVSGLTTTGTVERTGAGAYSTYSVTAAGKALLDDADVTAQRTTLGLGSAAEEDIGASSGDIPILGTDLTANGIMMANGTGTAIDSVTCSSSQYLVYNGTSWACTAIPTGTDTAAFHQGGDSFGATATLGTNENYALNLETNGSTKMTILPGGNVGVGTTSPGQKLTVNGMIESLTGGIKFPDGSIQTTSAIADGTNNSVLTGWPDAIVCDVTAPITGKLVLAFNGHNFGNGLSSYAMPDPNAYWIVYYNTSTQAFDSYAGFTTSNCNVSIPTLYAAGRAFNYAKGPAAQWLQSGSDAYYNAGKVGIGTTTPGTAFEVYNSVAAPSIRYGRNGVAGYGEFNVNNIMTGSNADMLYLPTGSGTGTGGHAFYVDAGSASNFAMGITRDGNVGIGTTAPAYKLDVASAIRTFGTNSVQSILHNTGVGGRDYRMASTDDSNGLGGGKFAIYDQTAGATRFLIDSYGNVGIGTSAPVNDLDVRGTARFGTSSSGAGVALVTDQAGYGLFTTTTSAANVRIVADNRAAPEGITVTNGGNVGIGTISPNYTLHVNGTVAGSGAYVNASDLRYKTNISPIENSLDKITSLHGAQFEWRTDEYPEKNFKKGQDIGVIAQEVQRIFPEAVEQDDEGYFSVAYSKLIAPLIEAIKELRAEKDKEVDELKAQIQMQSGLILKLEERLKRLERETEPQ